MTAARTAGAQPIGAHQSRDRSAGSTLSADRPSNAPVMVLAPAYAGASTLRSLLEDCPDLACTSGTGLLPLCAQAMATWRIADGRPASAPSSLAYTATRTLATTVITSILVREGKSRWCEVAAVNPQAAETFLRLYPGARFLCLYRSCPGVIRAALDASPWGITDSAFAVYPQVPGQHGREPRRLLGHNHQCAARLRARARPIMSAGPVRGSRPR